MSGLESVLQCIDWRLLAGKRLILLPIPDIQPVEPGIAGIRQITTRSCRSPPRLSGIQSGLPPPKLSVGKLQLPLDRLKSRLLAQGVQERIGLQKPQARIA